MLSFTRRGHAGLAFVKKLPIPPMSDGMPDLKVSSSFVLAGIDLYVS